MPEPLERITLTGRHVQLEPLQLELVDELVAAASIERSTYDFTDVPRDVEAMTTYVTGLLHEHAAARVLPFAQRRLDTGELAGCTRLMDLRWWRGRSEPDEVEIGGTWLASTAQRTSINTEAKYLLLSHAFEHYGVWRVQLCTDEDNARSRAAIERIGASFEGILRNHRLRYNTPAPTPRNTAVFSITDAEWPEVKERLAQRLAER